MCAALLAAEQPPLPTRASSSKRQDAAEDHTDAPAGGRLELAAHPELEGADATKLDPGAAIGPDHPEEDALAGGAACHDAGPARADDRLAESPHVPTGGARVPRDGHLDREDLAEDAGGRVAVQHKLSWIHLRQPPVGPKRSVRIRSGG